MADTIATSVAVTNDGGRAFPSRIVGILAVTQTVGYGVLHYAFAVLLTPMASDLNATTASVAGAFTLSVLIAAAAAIPVGRWLDKHGGRVLMTAGSILGVAAVIAWSQVENLWQLYAAFLLIGLAAAASLYEAAFPVVIAACNPLTRDRALLVVTIVAGFASSIFFPLTGLLLEHVGWRTALLILATMLAVVAVPAHAGAIPGRAQSSAQRHSHPHGASVHLALHDRAFWLLAVAFVAHAAAVSVVGVLLITALRQMGHPATVAATLSGLLGVLSVTGRLVTTGAARRRGMLAATAVVFAIQAVGVIALPHLGQTVAGAAICVIAFGLGFGVATIARPSILADRFGTTRYATIAATMTVPITLAKAFAPLGAALITTGQFLMTSGILCLISAGLLWSAREHREVTV
jgi:MFS family permease